MASRRSMPGPGCCQWNTVAWFVCQIGFTGWMLVGAIVLTRAAPEVALAWLVCFLVANTLGCRLWAKRRRLRPFPAMQAGILGCGLSGLVGLTALHTLRPGFQLTRAPGLGLRDEPWSIPAYLVLVLLLMAQAAFLEWSARRERVRARPRARPASKAHTARVRRRNALAMTKTKPWPS